MVFSSRHMIVFAALALGLTGRLSAAVDPALVNEYRQRWIERERDTAMEADRIQLARDLYAAAKGHVSRPMKILLLHKSYEWGRRDFPGGYYHASRALQLIQRTDARQRTACLEKLAALFQDAWSRGRRTRLGDGAGYAEVQYQIAQQRLLDLMRDHRTRPEGVTREQFLAELHRVRRHAGIGVVSARTVLASAQSALRRPDITSRGRRVFGNFVTEHGPLLVQLRKQQEDATRLADSYKTDGDKALPPHQRAGVAAPRPTPPPPVATTPTRPDPKPPATEPAPPDPPTTQPDPPDPPVVVITPPVSGGLNWRERKCRECQESFVPRHGSKDHVCYWCRNPLGFFRDSGSK